MLHLIDPFPVYIEDFLKKGTFVNDEFIGLGNRRIIAPNYVILILKPQRTVYKFDHFLWLPKYLDLFIFIFHFISFLQRNNEILWTCVCVFYIGTWLRKCWQRNIATRQKNNRFATQKRWTFGALEWSLTRCFHHIYRFAALNKSKMAGWFRVNGIQIKVLTFRMYDMSKFETL